MKRVIQVAALAVAISSALYTHAASAADADLTPDEEYEKKINAAKTVAPLTSEFSGEQISLYDGSTSFVVTDVSLPGNNALPVSIARTFKVEERRNESYLIGFGDWEIDLPRIEGVFLYDRGWKIQGDAPYARCSRPDLPDASVPNVIVSTRDVWQGTYLHLPGQGAQELLVNNQTKLPAVADGRTYPWIASGFTRVRCLDATANQYPGEAFVALTADGTEYTFNHVVSRPTTPIRVPNQYGTYQTTLARARVSFLVTQVRDRFGNTVDYTYDGDKLTGIQSSDGRSITLGYEGELIRTIAAGTRTWTYNYQAVTGYRYPATLSEVVLPDQTKWTYSGIGSLKTYRDAPLDGGQDYMICPEEADARLDDTGYQLTVGHPSGARLSYEFMFGRMRRAHTPIKGCRLPQGTPAPIPYAAHYWDGYRIYRKTLTGPGLVAQRWDYDISAGAMKFYTSGSATDSCADCEMTKSVKVTEPDGDYKRYTFGISYGLNEGQLLKVEQGHGTDPVMQTTTTEYIITPEASAQRFPDEVGGSRNLVYSFSSRLRPAKRTTIVRDGDTFQSAVVSSNGLYEFDVFGNALKTVKSNSVGFTKTDETSYWHNFGRWILSQPESSKTNGTEVSRTQYDLLGLPRKAYSFGKLKRSLDYNADGTLSVIRDGADHATGLSSWYRGVPRLITFSGTPENPTGATQSAEVDSNGWIRAVTDEVQATTRYDYDPMGRLSSITYPVGDTTAWNATTIVTAPYTAGPEFGLEAGHWTQTISTGNARNVTYLDALWRPIVEQEYDATTAATVAATKRTTRHHYDQGGNEVFTSYPGVEDGLPTGIHKVYDALGRVRQVDQDSELGFPLTTKTDYPGGLRSQVTNPRRFVTTTSYVAYDQPSYDAPIGIIHPEGAYTDISRNVFGLPLAITRRDGTGALRVDRKTVYDQYMQPCKAIEPETGVSVAQFDAAGNLDWSAAGQTVLNAVDCSDVAAVPTTERVTRTYDARNKLRSILFPDGGSDTSYTYTPDGLVNTVTADNGAGSDVTTTYGYNKRRLLTSERLQFDTTAWSLGYDYNGNAALSGQTYPAGLHVDYAPNALGQPTRAGAYATGVAYYPNGAMKQFTYGNGIVHSLVQNARGLPDRSRDALGATAVLDDGYDYDENGNVAAITDGLPGNRRNRDMTYDGLDRLKTAASPMFNGTVASYTYDVLDNLTHVVAPGRDHYYCYDSSWHLTNIKMGSCSGPSVIGLGYDPQGNVTNKNGVTYGFDDGNRMRSASGNGVPASTYLYDGQGRRVQDTTTTPKRSIYSFGGQIVYEDNQRTGIKSNYIYLNGSLVARDSDPSALGTPSLTVPASDTTKSYAVQWSALATASRYELQEQFGAGAWSQAYGGSGTSWTASGKAQGTYNYRVRGCASTVCGNWSATKTVVESSPTPPPSTAPVLTVPANGPNGSYSVSWTTVSGATSYTLNESANGGAWAAAYSGPGSSAAFSSRPAGSYAYTVKACNSTGCGPTSASPTVQVVYPPAAAPTVSLPASNSNGSYAVSWSAVSGATSYLLEESTNGGAWVAAYNGGGLSQSIVGAAGGTHAYRAKACNVAGCGGLSATATVVVTYPPSAAPSVSTPATSATGSYTVSWTGVGGATSYRLEEAVNGGAWVLLQNTANTAFGASGKGDGAYSYRAQACNAGGCGPYSATGTTTVNIPPPAAPTLNVPSSPAAGQAFTVSWTASSTATSYQLEESVKGGAWTLIYNGSGQAVSRTKTVGTYSYRVRACSAKGCGGYSATQTANVIRDGCSTCLLPQPDPGDKPGKGNGKGGQP